MEGVSSSNDSKHEGIFLLANQIFEPLDTLLMAYESTLKFADTLEIQWEKYLDPKLEKHRLTKCKWLLKVTQSLMEQELEEIARELEAKLEPQHVFPKEINFETWEDRKSDPPKETPKQKHEQLLDQVVEDIEDQGPMEVPKVEDILLGYLWDMVEKEK